MLFVRSPAEWIRAESLARVPSVDVESCRSERRAPGLIGNHTVQIVGRAAWGQIRQLFAQPLHRDLSADEIRRDELVAEVGPVNELGEQAGCQDGPLTVCGQYERALTPASALKGQERAAQVAIGYVLGLLAIRDGR